MSNVNAPAPLVDSFGRAHSDLRVSVTDRCNIRCVYCMPEEGVQFKPHSAILTFEEIERFVRVIAGLGVGKLRVTGGEPLVRRGICRLVKMLSAVPGIAEVAMTTNGILLGEYAQELRAAGLTRLNISLDTLDRERFRQLSRRDELPRVLEGIAAAQRAGFTQIKLNAVAIRGQSEDDVAPLARFARQNGFELRFIEFMPLDGDNRWERSRVLPGKEILRLLASAIGPLEPVADAESRAPANEYRFSDGLGRVGIIASVSEPFCDRCGRLRLTAEGMLRNCLFSTEGWDAKSLLRSGADDDALRNLIGQAVRAKKRQRGTDEGPFAETRQAMYEIGG